MNRRSLLKALGVIGTAVIGKQGMAMAEDLQCNVASRFAERNLRKQTVSDYLENQILESMLRGAPMVQCRTTYVALFTSDGREVDDYSWYRRQRVEWHPAQEGCTSNVKTIKFPTTTRLCVGVTFAAIYDQVYRGNVLFGPFPMNAVKNIHKGDSLQFAPGDIEVTLD